MTYEESIQWIIDNYSLIYEEESLIMLSKFIAKMFHKSESEVSAHIEETINDL